jgi:hypothetical protein
MVITPQKWYHLAFACMPKRYDDIGHDVRRRTFPTSLGMGYTIAGELLR